MNNLKLIPFDNMQVKQIELKYTDSFKWLYAKKLITLSKVNNINYQCIMVFDGIAIDLYYCEKEKVLNAIREINSFTILFKKSIILILN